MQSTIARLARTGKFPGGHYEVAVAYTFASEFYNATLDHYFLASDPWEIDDLFSGRHPGWTATGARLEVAGGPTDASGIPSPACRLYLPPGQGDSHFFSIFPGECAAAVARLPGVIEESPAAFYATLPDPVTGACPPNSDLNGFDELRPVYRLWNGRADSNHRYTQDPVVRAQMIARGYVPEGYGPMGVAMCAP